jgi:hypothetical protein
VHGRAAAGTQRVSLEREAADGSFAEVTSVTPAADGAFAASLPADGPAVYRAVAGGEASRPLALPVSARLSVTLRRRAGGAVVVRAHASPSQAGAPAALQVYRRERFDWRRADHARIDARSTVRFVMHPRRSMRVRVVLLRGRGGFAPAVGAPVRVR